ncbi:MAG: dolichyl-phosphate-mannose--protein mannosyltransferase [Sporichthyaceae bacterium]
MELTKAEAAEPAAAPAPDPLRSAMPRGPWAWWGPVLVTLLAAIVRFKDLGRPHAVVFDETYYVKDSWSLLKSGYERAYVEGADGKLLGGDTDILKNDATFVVHPPVGKWIIAIGEWIGGLDPTGWRLSVAIVGTAMVFLISRIAMRLTGSIVLGCIAGGLLALDGLAVVMSRTALLDGILAFFVLAAFGALLIDRDRFREALAGGRTYRWRHWRLLAGVGLGMALGTKWSALPFVAAFGILTVLWDVGARRAAGNPTPRRTVARLDLAPAFLYIVGVSTVVYLIGWTGYLATGGGWSRQWATGRDTAFPFIPDPLRSLWHYHWEMLNFHTNLTQDHPYRSSPWGWSVLARPVAYYSQDSSQGQGDCRASSCVSEVLGLGTPVIWWAATAALFFLLWRWIGARDWRAGAVLAGVAAGWLPWFRYSDRPIFHFYAITFLPFLILGLTLALGALIGRAPESRAGARRRALGSTLAGAVVVLVVVNFFYIYPVLTAGTLSREDWMSRMWFTTWI